MEKQIKRAYLEITNICNLDCSFCPIQERDRNTMSLEQINNAFEQIAPIAEEVSLHLMGEPLAHPNFDSILDLCEKKNIVLQLTTNGILLNKYTQGLLNTKLIKQINISLQSFIDNYPEKSLTEYLDLVTNFIDLAVEKRPEIYINLRLWNLQSENSDDLRSQNEKIFKYIEEKYNLEINRKVEVGNIKSKKLFHRVYLHFDSRFKWLG